MKKLTFGLVCLTYASMTTAQEYTVKDGDTLRAISAVQLGNSGKWQEICDLNTAVIATCDLIFPGMVLVMPGAEQSDFDGVSRQLAGADLSKALSADNTGFTISPMDNGAKISGAPEQVSPGGRPGIFVALGKKFEEAASGDTVKVTVTIEAENPGLFSAAYSTSDVGNSGWQSMQFQKGESSLSFNYAVPKLKNGNDDFVGVLPDPEATGQAITITAIEVEILPQ
ncbi:LysM peptidoglycan-binding domain-containing protein [Parasedimentitalea huanghaiensis]|uniref:LysM peptidoglycan-binding domain-containing protein n=1 Tax=Parasedimentitalea huanghaiensis TaxID=2682100 RepID=A0A6L6WMV1_9RHOB|nr:LysM peptidoglycan-binding domain-containing protein [Zongyanglinia huanghaiensis]MVO18568.1 LysM peptidoglycan-binding domain-containing protein [Zongyanglinia huanghaiensis]